MQWWKQQHTCKEKLWFLDWVEKQIIQFEPFLKAHDSVNNVNTFTGNDTSFVAVFSHYLNMMSILLLRVTGIRTHTDTHKSFISDALGTGPLITSNGKIHWIRCWHYLRHLFFCTRKSTNSRKYRTLSITVLLLLIEAILIRKQTLQTSPLWNKVRWLHVPSHVMS